MKVSVVMAYYNRKPLLYHTLKTFQKFVKYSDYEIIIVDDYSDENHNLSNIHNDFPDLPIKIYEMKFFTKTKYYYNPCIPLNLGISKTLGDVIVLQCPEVAYYNKDIVSHAAENVTNENYLVYSVYNIAGVDTEKLRIFQKTGECNFTPMISKNGFGSCWYQHPKWRSKCYNFCSAISRPNMKELNGFNEELAFGCDYDDTEFIHRIIGLGLKIIQEENYIAIHQDDPYDPNMKTGIDKKERLQLKNKNNIIFQNLISQKYYKVNSYKEIIK